MEDDDEEEEEDDDEEEEDGYDDKDDEVNGGACVNPPCACTPVSAVMSVGARSNPLLFRGAGAAGTAASGTTGGGSVCSSSFISVFVCSSPTRSFSAHILFSLSARRFSFSCIFAS